VAGATITIIATALGGLFEELPRAAHPLVTASKHPPPTSAERLHRREAETASAAAPISLWVTILLIVVGSPLGGKALCC